MYTIGFLLWGVYHCCGPDSSDVAKTKLTRNKHLLQDPKQRKKFKLIKELCGMRAQGNGIMHKQI